MREKYIEEQYPRLFVLGKDMYGRAHVTTQRFDVGVNMTPNEADALVAYFDKVYDQFVRTTLVFAEASMGAFTEFWCGRGPERTAPKTGA